MIWVRGNIGENKLDIAKNPKIRGASYISFWNKSSNNQLKIGKNFVGKHLVIEFKSHNCKITIGDNVTLCGRLEVYGKNRTMTIGNNTTVIGGKIMCRDANVSIGNHCLFSREIEIRSTDVHKIYDLDTDQHLNPSKDIKIGNRVWMGIGALISKGSVIQDDSIVGAKSFVNKSFEEKNVIIAGTPAKIIKSNIYWKR